MNIVLPARKIPVLTETDVVVCGGGPAGIAAAVGAARHGARVTLLERWPSVGGQATNALVNIWHTSDRVRPVIFGLVQELIERCGEGIWRLPGYPSSPETHEFDPGQMRLAMESLLKDAGVRVLCHLAAGEALVEEGRIRGVLADTKTGRKALLGRVVIDATGDGHIAAGAGLPFDFGRPGDGRVQGMTMMFRLCGLDPAKALACPAEADRVFRLMQELRYKGAFPPFMDYAARSYLRSPRPHTVSYNMCPVAGNPLDEEELTALSMQARRQVADTVALWRREMPGFERAEIEQMGFELGVRESRRVRGLKTLTAEMVIKAVKQPDAIGHGFWMVDIHDPKGSGHTTWADRKADSMPPVGESYHIPLGMCLNARIPNLAVVGRCASATHEGIASCRLQTHCMVMGQGVGTAAALALSADMDMACVDPAALQATLKSDGVYLEDVPAKPVRYRQNLDASLINAKAHSGTRIATGLAPTLPPSTMSRQRM
ncbi:MAG: FAD-dependent oxidoreductase [Kiritimatiellae bacterium]|nr:FAD-dependent oxidoreductase [Kiritimatiellia bacterium]